MDFYLLRDINLMQKTSGMFFLSVSIGIVLVGCAKPYEKPETTVDKYFEKKYGESLSNAEMRVMKSWTQVAGVTRAVQSKDIPSPPSDREMTGPLVRKVNVDWIGPPSPLLLSLAHRIGWDFVELGSHPPITPVVTAKGNGTIMLFLREIGSQLSQADVQVDSNHRTITLLWGGAKK